MLESQPATFKIEEGAIRRFAEAIGDMNPLYHDEGYAIAHGHRGLVAPPTFPIIFWDLKIPGLELPKQGLIHAEESFELLTEIVAGDRITSTTRLISDTVKQGHSGRMRFVLCETTGINESGETAYRSLANLIVREGVA